MSKPVSIEAYYNLKIHAEFLRLSQINKTKCPDTYAFTENHCIRVDGETIRLDMSRQNSTLALKILVEKGKVCLTDAKTGGTITNNGDPYLTIRDQVLDKLSGIRYSVFIISEETNLTKNVKYLDRNGNKHYLCTVTSLSPSNKKTRYLAVIPDFLLNDENRGTEQQKNLLGFLISINNKE